MDRLWLDAERMRALGYRTVDLMVAHLARLETAPILRTASPEEMRGRLGGPPPEEGGDFEAILDRLREDVLAFISRGEHPRYLAFIPASPTWPGALGDLIASAANVYAGSWRESAGPSQVELTVLDWFKGWIGYPREAAGLLVSGGSMANLTALACAREAVLGPMDDRAVAYVSDQAHSSMARAARVLGFRPDQVRVLPVDRAFRLRPETVAAAMDADVRSGRRPLVVCAAAGSTNTGAIDPLPELADLCERRGVWLHVDAAYGGFAAITARGRERLRGIERADSVTLDPHKWLYQPFECGGLLVRRGELLWRAFEISPDYLHDDAGGAEEVNFSDLGVQLTRRSQAIKVWLSLQFFGLAAFREAVDRSLDLAEWAAGRIERSASLELMAPVSLGVVCFRRRPEGLEDEEALAEANAGLVEGLVASDVGMVSSTRLHGRFAVRMCVLNHSTTREDVERVIAWFERAPTEPGRAPAPRGFDRDPGPAAGWLGRPDLDGASLTAIPLFRSLDERGAADLLRSARRRVVSPGEPVVRQWEFSREFYVVLEGAATVAVEERGEVVATLGPGDFFGELAALEWGASYGYPRLASVVAATPLRLLVLSPETLRDLMERFPEVEAGVRAAARERLSGPRG